jgi:hypothetical protein
MPPEGSEGQALRQRRVAATADVKSVLLVGGIGIAAKVRGGAQSSAAMSGVASPLRHYVGDVLELGRGPVLGPEPAPAPEPGPEPEPVPVRELELALAPERERARGCAHDADTVDSAADAAAAPAAEHTGEALVGQTIQRENEHSQELEKELEPQQSPGKAARAMVAVEAWSTSA